VQCYGLVRDLEAEFCYGREEGEVSRMISRELEARCGRKGLRAANVYVDRKHALSCRCCGGRATCVCCAVLPLRWRLSFLCRRSLRLAEDGN
jgi:hypothetical protein